MWPLPGLFPGHPALFNPREDIKPLSPAGASKDRSKLSSGSSNGGGPDKDLPALVLRETGNGHGGGIHDDKLSYEHHNGDDIHHDLPYDKSPKMPAYGGKLENSGNGGGIAGYVPTQRLEWKRYKQYTRSDIMAAIEEVKKG